MKRRYWVLIGICLGSVVHAEDMLRDLSFAGGLDARNSDNGRALSVAGKPGGTQQLLLEVDDPGISKPVYAIKGLIRYDGVEGNGFLQMDSHFGERGTFFSKSLAPDGPMQAISGDSDWRPFTLAFRTDGGNAADDTVMLPEKLTLSLVLPGNGNVQIKAASLYQYDAGENPLAVSGAWFDSQTAGIVGGIAGAVIGMWAAFIGVLAGRGKAKVFALMSANIVLIAGIVCAIVGVVALLTGQPYAVYYSLLLLAIITIVVVGWLRRLLPLRYEALELKKMQAMDS